MNSLNTNPDVEKFLAVLIQTDPEKHVIIQKLRELVYEIEPEISETIKYGGILFSNTEDCGGVFPSKNHVSFEFSEGFKIVDPKKRLEGTGKFRRHLKIVTSDDIKIKEVGYFVKQMIKS
jgi:uncharacterized protein YdhG (YjbR/CyaY superfamily)